MEPATARITHRHDATIWDTDDMDVSRLQSSEPGSLHAPSLFWQKLSSTHSLELSRNGFDNIKRKQALRYFNWQWKWGSIWQSRQMRFLLGNLSAADIFSCALTPTGLTGPDWQNISWNRFDRWLYVFAIRLLWEFARRNDRLGLLDLEEPVLGNPLPVYWRDRLVSQDLANGALELNWLFTQIPDHTPKSIVEIGAGYGRNAYLLLNMFPEARYTIIDIEPALSISRWYLGTLFPERRIDYVHASAAGSLTSGSFDLGIAISSLHEMTWQQIHDYLALLDQTTDKGFVYLKQWRAWHNPDDDIIVKFDDYQIPGTWNLLNKEAAAVQTNFAQAVWQG